MDDLICRVHEAIKLPLMQRGLFTALGVPPPSGVLMYGPPGTGKTLLARSVCAALNLHVTELSTATLLGAWFGDAENRLREAFKDARAHAPAVLFMDEIDAIGASRDAPAGGDGADGRLLALLLTGARANQRLYCSASSDSLIVSWLSCMRK